MCVLHNLPYQSVNHCNFQSFPWISWCHRVSIWNVRLHFHTIANATTALERNPNRCIAIQTQRSRKDRWNFQAMLKYSCHKLTGKNAYKIEQFAFLSELIYLCINKIPWQPPISKIDVCKAHLSHFWPIIPSLHMQFPVKPSHSIETDPCKLHSQSMQPSWSDAS